MKWEEIIATEYCESVRDGTHETPRQTESGYKLVTGKHIKNGQIVLDDAYYISENDYTAINQRSLVEKWDVLFSMIGTVGEVAVVKSVPAYAIKNVALFKCGGSELKGKWLFYYLQSPQVKSGIIGNLKGSSQQFLSLKQLRNLHILVTEKLKMQRIVDILSAYDDLIENNRKQIKLLEEAAQRLYKEWFVDLRFPGRETTPIVDGLPEGWTESSFGQICTVVKDTIKPAEKNDGIPYIGLEHIPRFDFCLSEWDDSSSVDSNKFRFKSDDILFGKIRPYFHKVGFALCDGIASTDAIVLRTSHELWALLLMCASSDAFVDYTYQTCKEGAKMPRADWNTMKVYKVLIADKKTMTAFSESIWIITRQVKALALQNRLLIQARDELLPKLMSGEIEV